MKESRRIKQKESQIEIDNNETLLSPINIVSEDRLEEVKKNINLEERINKMRNATKEEQDAVFKYMIDHSVKTGIRLVDGEIVVNNTGKKLYTYTNRDKYLKELSNTSLAVLLANDCSRCPFYNGCVSDSIDEKECIDRIENWLEQEVENDK